MSSLLPDKKVGFAILCDNAPHTLAMTLASYERANLLPLFDAAFVVFPADAPRVGEVARAHGVAAVPSGTEAGFVGGLATAVKKLDTDYLLLVEDDCMVWEHLRGPALSVQLQQALQLLESGLADMVRLRHAWRGSTRYKAAYHYSYFYPVEQLATLWVHSEGLSEAPDWVKSLRRFLHPVRSKRAIGRSVYVEQNPHLRFPEYIKKVENGYVIDSEVFQWTNQPTLISRSKMQHILAGLSRAQGGVGRMPHDFENAVNNPRWRSEHMNIGVVRGIFT